MNHRRMELILISFANDKNLNDVERNEIVETTIDIYLKKKQRRKTKHLGIEPPSNQWRNGLLSGLEQHLRAPDL